MVYCCVMWCCLVSCGMASCHMVWCAVLRSAFCAYGVGEGQVSLLKKFSPLGEFSSALAPHRCKGGQGTYQRDHMC